MDLELYTTHDNSLFATRWVGIYNGLIMHIYNIVKYLESQLRVTEVLIPFRIPWELYIDN